MLTCLLPQQLPGAVADDEFNLTWEKLRKALTDIHRRESSNLSFEELYRTVYKIVLKKKGDVLYDNVKQFEEQWLAENVIPGIKSLLSASLLTSTTTAPSASTANLRRQLGEEFLLGIRVAWEDHNRCMNMGADIMMYLERGYTVETSRPTIFTTTIGLFRDLILNSTLGQSEFPVSDILNRVLLDQINMERAGEVVDRNLVRSCVGMLYSLYETDAEDEAQKLYTTLFEPAFLRDSEIFYRRECEALLANGDAVYWLQRSRARLVEEMDRCRATIRPDTKDAILQVVERELISAHMQDFLSLEGSGLKWMIDNDKTDDIAIMYELVARVDEKKETMRNILQARVVALGLEIENALKNTDFSVAPGGAGELDDGEAPPADKGKAPTRTAAAQQTAAAIKWVDDVLLLKEKFDRLWRRCFEGDLIIQTTLTRSFSDFINMFTRSAEYVSLYVDDILKRGIRGKTEAEVDVLLERAITIIRYLQDKDMFERYYQKHLARRLLHAKSESHDVEKQMLLRMKQELGNQFTTHFEGMFRDMDTSAELSAQYRDHIRNLGDVEAGVRPIELNINVLTTNFWPSEVQGRTAQSGRSASESGAAEAAARAAAAQLGYVYPPEIKKLQESVTKFYLTNRTGRKLTWVATAGTAELRCVFPAIPGKTSGPLARERRYEITVPTCGMLVLLLFNDLEGDDAALSAAEIQAKTNMPTAELMRTLTSLSMAPKSRVLLREPQSKGNVRMEDSFRFNAGFVSKSVKVRVPILSATAKVEGDDERRETEQRNVQTRKHVIDAAIVRIMKYVLLVLFVFFVSHPSHFLYYCFSSRRETARLFLLTMAGGS